MSSSKGMWQCFRSVKKSDAIYITSVFVRQQRETQELFRGIPSPEKMMSYNPFLSNSTPKNFSVLSLGFSIDFFLVIVFTSQLFPNACRGYAPEQFQLEEFELFLSYKKHKIYSSPPSPEKLMKVQTYFQNVPRHRILSTLFNQHYKAIPTLENKIVGVMAWWYKSHVQNSSKTYSTSVIISCFKVK